MRGPLPKPPGLKQRRNKDVTRAILPSEKESRSRKVPALPPREKSTEVWHPLVLEWWESVWKSPMAGEFLPSDIRGGLYLVAELYQRRWEETDSRVLLGIAAEIRQQEQRFGLSPIDRRRLQWEVEKGEQAVEKTTRRKRSKQVEKATAGKDPRDLLKLA